MRHHAWSSLASLCAAVALTACGGGSNEARQVSSAAADDNTVAAREASTLRVGTGASPTAATVWTLCASEGGSCNYSGSRPVRYGTATSHAARLLIGPTPCTNAVFGDPAPGLPKSCWVGASPREDAPLPAPPAVATYYFSDCQADAAAGCVPGDDANPGTSVGAPKRTLGGFDINALPAGAQLLFRRGGSWNHTMVRLDNRNATPALPIVFDAYGSGAAPILRTAANHAFETGSWQNTVMDGGYTFRNLKLDGLGTATWGIWLRGAVRNVTIDSVEITRFQIGLNSQGDDPQINDTVVRNSRIVRNSSMGVLGGFNGVLFEGNTFEENNFSGSTFNHAIYLSGGNRLVLRDNRFIRNSTVNGTCLGGNLTVHGQVDGLLLENNTITQDASADGCWGISITAGYSSAEWFRHAVVRGNTITNLGGCAICINAAPGIVVENNRTLQDHTRWHYAVWINATAQANDDPGGGEIVRNNLACLAVGAPNQGDVQAPSRVQLSGNVLRTGPESTTGACAR